MIVLKEFFHSNKVACRPFRGPALRFLVLSAPPGKKKLRICRLIRATHALRANGNNAVFILCGGWLGWQWSQEDSQKNLLRPATGMRALATQFASETVM